jgi:hypothetical protein
MMEIKQMKPKKRTSKENSTRGGYRDNAGRKSGWNHKDTCTIRIPKAFASQLIEVARRLDKVDKIDTDTESKLTDLDLVTQSKLVGTNGEYKKNQELEKESAVNFDTKCQDLADDTVTKSTISSKESLVHQTKQLEKEVLFDNDTESMLPEKDFVTESNSQITSKTSHISFHDFNSALREAKTILTAKKSARESIARLLSKLYSTHVVPLSLSKD